jgi:hypothetical protein
MRTIDFTNSFDSSNAPIAGSTGITPIRSYATDAAYVSGKGSVAENGDTYYNSTYHALRCYQNSAWHFLRVADVLTATSDATFVTAKGSAAADGDIYLQSTDKVLRAMVDSAWRSISYGAPNYVINGNMDFWQRETSATGISSTTRSYGCVDRWCVWSGSASTTTSYSRVSSVPTVDPTAGGSRYSVNLQRAAGNTGTTGSYLCHAIESNLVYPLRAKTMTLAFFAKAGANFSAASSQMELFVGSGTGVDEIPSSAYTGAANVYAATLTTITTTYARYQYTFVIPATASELKIRFGFYGVGTAGADDSISITQVMLSEGGKDQPFVHHGGSWGTDLAACQRYYEKSYPIVTVPGTVTNAGAVAFRASGTSVEKFMLFKERKRAAPVVTLYSSATGGSTLIRDVTGAADVAASATVNTDDSGFYATKDTAGTDASRYDFHWAAQAEI